MHLSSTFFSRGILHPHPQRNRTDGCGGEAHSRNSRADPIQLEDASTRRWRQARLGDGEGDRAGPSKYDVSIEMVQKLLLLT